MDWTGSLLLLLLLNQFTLLLRCFTMRRGRSPLGIVSLFATRVATFHLSFVKFHFAFTFDIYYSCCHLLLAFTIRLMIKSIRDTRVLLFLTNLCLGLHIPEPARLLAK